MPFKTKHLTAVAVSIAVAALAACRGGPEGRYLADPAKTGPGEPVEPPGIPPGQSPPSAVILAISTRPSEQLRAASHYQADACRFEARATQAAVQRSADAAERAAAGRREANPHQRINRRLGTTLAVALALLDSLPAYWSAQALGLSRTSTLILTVLLCAALGGAMWLLDLYSRPDRRLALWILEGALAAGFMTMFALRLQYLQVTGGAGLQPWAIEASVLAGISAGLLVIVASQSARAGRRPGQRPAATAGRRASWLPVLAVGRDPRSSQTAPGRAPSRADHRIVQPGWTG